MREQRDHRREDAERDVARDIGAAQAEHGRGDETGEADEDRGEKRLSHDASSIMSPSPFVVEWVARRRARFRRHGPARERSTSRWGAAVMRWSSRPLAFSTFGVDSKLDALRDARRRRAARWLRDSRVVRRSHQHPLPAAWFDLVVVTRYLQRDLFRCAAASGQARRLVLYETFTTAQRALNTGPTSPDHLLEPGELRARFDVPGWDYSCFTRRRATPEAVAQLVAVRRIRNWRIKNLEFVSRRTLPGVAFLITNSEFQIPNS